MKRQTKRMRMKKKRTRMKKSRRRMKKSRRRKIQEQSSCSFVVAFEVWRPTQVRQTEVRKKRKKRRRKTRKKRKKRKTRKKRGSVSLLHQRKFPVRQQLLLALDDSRR
jgi:hypothetical protein